MILDCGHAPTKTASSCGTGYGTLPDGRKVCYPCCDAWAIKDMRANDEFMGYLSAECENVTTWTGGFMLRVTACWDKGNNMAGTVKHIQAIDALTKTEWYGTSPGPGMYARMHRAKSKLR